MAIRYDKKLENEINRTLRNFNSKVRRLEKQERDLIPNTITKEQLKQGYDTRTDLVRKLKELQRFSNRGAENIIRTTGGAEITRYELENLKRDIRRAKYNITKELKRLEVEKPTIFGRKQDVTFAQMGDDRYLNKKTTYESLNKDIRKLNKKELESLLNRVGRELFYQNYEKSKFKESYFQMVEDLGYFYKVDPKKMEKIKEKLFSLNPEKFLKAFNTDKAIKSIIEYYVISTGGKRKSGIKQTDIQDDVTTLFNNLYENIDKIVANYE